MFTYYFEGFWLLHSHLGHHQSQGMALVFQEGDTRDMVPTPPNFPTCGSFQTSKEEIEEAINIHKKKLLGSEIKTDFGNCISFYRLITSELLNQDIHHLDILVHVFNSN